MSETLTRERLAELLEFDTSISRFSWKERPGNKSFNIRHAGKVAGYNQAHSNSAGLYYRVVTVDDQPYKEHRLIWLWHTGQFPEYDLDHKDGDGRNNSQANLRLAANGINSRNRAKSSANTSGHTGVMWSKQRHKWVVRAKLNGKLYFNGYFDLSDLDKAVAAAAELRAKLGFSPTHGLTREERKMTI